MCHTDSMLAGQLWIHPARARTHTHKVHTHTRTRTAPRAVTFGVGHDLGGSPARPLPRVHQDAIPHLRQQERRVALHTADTHTRADVNVESSDEGHSSGYLDASHSPVDGVRAKQLRLVLRGVEVKLDQAASHAQSDTGRHTDTGTRAATHPVGVLPSEENSFRPSLVLLKSGHTGVGYGYCNPLPPHTQHIHAHPPTRSHTPTRRPHDAHRHTHSGRTGASPCRSRVPAP